jgi:chromosome segregation and condensation protein ScpB
LDGKAKKFSDFHENVRVMLENIEFCQGEPLTKELLELISKVKEEKLYKEFMSKRKDYERNYLAIYLKENRFNMTIGLSRIKGEIYESLVITNNPIL